ncbi:glycosyltransferase family 2 protein [Roseivivax lentus]|uniref:glycosyltransferase family 2 protein n=1 Tax=Roseivivax lentus TaxID=633194 RepID=UPI001F3A4C5E|nr:glycosyltransferase family 2 protein [Roseivivax lentus]
MSIVVVSYNTKDMTLECIRSILTETKCGFELIVYDNASSDGSAQAIADEFPETKLIASEVNHGFAKANNIAAGQVSGKYLLLLNPDTVVLNGAIDKLVSFAGSRPEARIWGGRTLYGDQSLNPTNCWGRMTLWSVTCQAFGLTSLFRDSALFNPEGYGGWPRDTERAVDIVSGCLFLIERDLWNQLGGFDPAFTMYGEEADLCLRARAIGAHPRITPDAEIVHYVGASTKVRANKLIMLLKAKVTLIHRYFPEWQRAPGVLLLTCWPLSRMVGARILWAMFRKPKWKATQLAWTDVWKARSEWRGGYSQVQ